MLEHHDGVVPDRLSELMREREKMGLYTRWINMLTMMGLLMEKRDIHLEQSKVGFAPFFTRGCLSPPSSSASSASASASSLILFVPTHLLTPSCHHHAISALLIFISDFQRRQRLSASIFFFKKCKSIRCQNVKI